MYALQVSVKPYQAKDIIEQQARKTRSSRIPWSQITKSRRYSELISDNKLYSNHEQHLRKLKKIFIKAVKQIQLTILDKNYQLVHRYYYDQEKDEFVRRNEFEEIKTEDTLLKFIKNSPKGVLVTDQLLDFTYKQVQKDIDKLLSSKSIKKINSSNKTKKDYYLFANTIELQYGLSDSYEHFGKDEYLEFCKKNYKTFDDLGDNENFMLSGGGGSYNSQSFNEWVPGYAELKEEWLLKNREKTGQQKGRG